MKFCGFFKTYIGEDTFEYTLNSTQHPKYMTFE